MDVGPNSEASHTIGGISPNKRNLISANNDNSIELRNVGGGNKVQANLIGTAKDSTSPLGGHQVGVFVEASDDIIGGTEPGAANVIANGFEEGVPVVSGDNTGNRILSNSIFSNRGLGTDLGGEGSTPNDLRERDKGPNNRQNFPVITSAVVFEEGTADSRARWTARRAPGARREASRSSSSPTPKTKTRARPSLDKRGSRRTAEDRFPPHLRYQSRRWRARAA